VFDDWTKSAIVEGGYRYSWGIADKLHKSESKYFFSSFEIKDKAL